MSGAEVVVVGGGVIGCATARLLAMQGVAVTVVERAAPAMEASWAAAGMLSPLAEAHRPDPFLTLLLAAAARFPPLAEHLLSETGIDVGYRSDGTLFLAIEDSDEELLENRWRWQSARGLAVDRLSRRETLALEPAAAPRTRWALRYPDDHQVDSRELSRALWRAAEAAGARFVIGRSVAGLARNGARVTGVKLEDGEMLAAEAVVIAAGSWAGQLAGLPRPVPVEPVHGQLIALAAGDLQVRHVVDTPRIYLVPRADGRIIAGATAERTGFEKAVTERGISALLAGATEAIPSLAGRPILESWSGLRPGTPDGHPIIGRDPDVGNLVYATGHFRNGILLAPITAEAVAALLTGGRPLPETEGFGIERFADVDG